jgi:hypothetical protein
LSDSVVDEAAHQAIAIAAGLPRAEVEQRAQRAFDSANDIRARLRGLPDTAKRAQAASRARTWAEILQHMDSTGEEEFCGYPYDGGTPPAVVRAVWIMWDWLAGYAQLLNVAAVARACQDVFGAKPITFYHWPEPPAGVESAPAARAAGVGTPSTIRGDGDASPTGGYNSPAALPGGPTGNQGSLQRHSRAFSHLRRDRRPVRRERRRRAESLPVKHGDNAVAERRTRAFYQAKQRGTRSDG